MKRYIKVLTATAIFVSIVFGQEFAGGNGTENNPWIITTKEHLQNVRNYLGEEHQDKHFKLGGDIALNGSANNQWEPIGFEKGEVFFWGNFDGAGYVINGIYIDKNSECKGLFGVSFGVINNLGIVESFIKGEDFVGGLVGYNSGTISNCYVIGNIEGVENIGGLVGENGGTIISSYSIGNVKGTESVGGLVGENEGIIKNSYSTADVQGVEWVGGLAGYSDILIENCYSVGNVQGNTEIGGLVGISVSDFGGIIKNSYYNSQTSGQNDNNGRGEPKTTVELKQMSTYIDWDFTDIWGINRDINDGYPYLRIIEDGNLQNPISNYVSKKQSSVSFAGISNGQINLHLQTGNYTVELYNLQGRMLRKININAINGVNATGLKTAYLSKGMVILNVKQKGVSVLREKISVR